MNTEVGRFLEGRLYELTLLLKMLLDLGTGLGADVEVRIEGREMVFFRHDKAAGRGFMRLIPQETTVMMAFPRGPELFDPQKRARSSMGSQSYLVLRHTGHVDLYVRRMLSGAYALDV